jgi:TetR/AcrR family transcriptional regulator, cholesterol catabolism regulator
MDAAMHLFGKQGYTGTSMRDIAGAVGVLPGSLYAHTDKMRAMIIAHVVVVADNPERSLVVFHQWRFLGEGNIQAAIAKRREYEQAFIGVIEEGMRAGTFRADLNLRIAVLTILGALNWSPEWLSPEGKLSSEAVGGLIADTLLTGVHA